MGDYIIKCRGLPWSTTAKDIISFFHDCNIKGGENGVHLPLDKMGRASGDCFVELESPVDMDTAKKHDKEHMGSRYVEIHESERSEMEWHISRGVGVRGGGGGGSGSGSDFVVKLRGLPYQATKKDITDFFEGLNIAPYGITFTMGNDGRPSGEGFVEFSSEDDVERAVAKNRETIGSRYIEIFKSSKQEVRFASENASGGYGGSGRGGPSRGPNRGRSGPYDRPGGPNSSHGAVISLGPSGFNTAGLVSRGGGGGGRGGGRGSSESQQPSKTGFMVHMRGLPFTATQGNVFQFFAPLNPVEVRLLYEDSGRPKGEADVDFNSYADAESAMKKDKQNMGHRYIELFLRCDGPSGGSGGSWGNNSGPMLPQNRNNGPGFMNSGGGGLPQSNMSSGGFGGGYESGGGGGNFNNMGGGFNGGYGGQSNGYSSFSGNKQGFQMSQGAGGNFY